MGREIRRVPGDWEHPRYTADDAPRRERIGEYRPLHDNDFVSASHEWWQEALQWANGAHPDQQAQYPFYWQWAGGPPEEDVYRERAWTPDEATHFQVYETVSEGTPVSPVFATEAELIDYLVEHGDFWDQHRGSGGWQREAAERFAKSAWAPSFIVTTGGSSAA